MSINYISDQVLQIFPSKARADIEFEKIVKRSRQAFIRRGCFATILDLERDLLDRLCKDDKIPDATVKFMLISVLLNDKRLRKFRNLGKFSSFKERLVELFDLMDLALVDEDSLDKITGYSTDKEVEIRYLYRRYRETLKRNHYLGKLDLIKRLHEIVLDKGLSHIDFMINKFEQIELVDIYKFLPYRFELIRLIAQYKKVVIHLPLPDGRVKMFGSLVYNMKKFENLAGDEGMLEIIPKNKDEESDNLRFLKKVIFSLPVPNSFSQDDIYKSRSHVRIISSHNRKGEIESIAKLILKSLHEKKYDFSDFILVSRNLNIYKDIIRSVFDKHNIRYEMNRSVSLFDTPVGRSVFSVIKLIKGEFSRDDILTVLKSKYFFRFKTVNIYKLRSAFISNNIIDSQYSNITKFLYDLKKGSKDKCLLDSAKILSLLLEKIRHISRVNTVSGFLKKVVDIIYWLSPGLVNDIHTENDKDEIESLEKLEEFIYRLKIIDKELKFSKQRFDIDTLLDIFLSLMHKVIITDKASRQHDMRSVKVLDIHDAIGMNVKNVILSGNHDGEFPLMEGYGSILASEEKELFNDIYYEKILLSNPKLRLGRKVFEKGYDNLQEDAYLFYLMLLLADENIILTYSNTDSDGKILCRSQFVDEILTSLYPINGEYDRKNHIEDYNDNIAEGKFEYIYIDRDLLRKAVYDISNNNDAIYELVKSNDIGKKLCIKTNIDRLKNLVAISIIERNRNDFLANIMIGNERSDTIYNGNVCGSRFFINKYIERKNYSYSPTELEKYGECPYKFFASGILNLFVESDPTLGISYTESGSMIHKVLETFYADKISSNGLPLDISFRSEYIYELEEIYKNLLASYRSKTYSNEKIIDNIIYKNNMIHLINWLDIELGKVDEGYLPLALEVKFGLSKGSPNDIIHEPELLTVSNDEKRYLVGIIDRIDINKKTKSVHLIDYKNSKYSSRYSDKVKVKNIGVTSFQIPIYMMLARKYILDNSIMDDIYNISSSYQLIKSDKIDKFVQFKKNDLKTAHDYIFKLDKAGNSDFKLALIDTINKIESGNFTPTVNLCDSCFYTALCRVSPFIKKH